MRFALAVLAGLIGLPALAHDGVVHSTPAESLDHETRGVALSPLPMPIDVQARFDLVDHTGRPVTQDDFAGEPMLIFFGYANCEAICSVALPRMAEALDQMGEDASAISALMITVDPDRDTLETLGPALAKWHPRLIGLTGTKDALANARAAFQVEASEVAEDVEGNPIYAHGSFIYLIGADGKALTLMPPILGPERMAQIISSYL